MKLIMSLDKDLLTEYCLKQVDSFYPDNSYGGLDREEASELINELLPMVLDKVECCLGSLDVPGYHDEEGNTIFSHLHADHYATFLYYLSNTIWKVRGNKVLASKFMYLNRTLHGIFISFKCELPNHFYLSHPVGTVLGNAEYGDFLVVHQSVTVNTGFINGKKLKIGKGAFLCAGCSIIGNEEIGDYVSVGAGVLIYNTPIPNNSVVKATQNNLCLVEKRKNLVCRSQRDFNIEF